MKQLFKHAPMYWPRRMLVRVGRRVSGNRAAGEQAPAAMIMRDTGSAVMMADIGFRCSLADRHGFDEWHQLPYRRRADQDINNPGNGSILAAEHSCYEVKLEESDQKPVQSADDDEKECDEIERAQVLLLSGLEAHQTPRTSERSRPLDKKRDRECLGINLPLERDFIEECEEGLAA